MQHGINRKTLKSTCLSGFYCHISKYRQMKWQQFESKTLLGMCTRRQGHGTSLLETSINAPLLDTLPTSGILLPTLCEQLHWIHIIIFRTKTTLLAKTTKSRSNARICGSDARMSRWPGHLSRECREMLSPILFMGWPAK